jgi:hypothetical protein
MARVAGGNLNLIADSALLKKEQRHDPGDANEHAESHDVILRKD